MKKSSRTLLIIAMICVVLGAGIAGAGFALGGKLHSGWGVNFGNPFGIGVVKEGTSTNKEIKIDIDAFENLDIDVSIGDVEIKRGNEYALYVRNIPEEDYNISQDKRTLKFKQETTTLFNFNLDFSDRDYKVTIIVPKDVELNEVKVDSSMGDIVVSDITCKELNLDQSMGDVSVEDVAVNGDTNIDQNMGDISFLGTLHGKSKFDNSMGNIEIKLKESKEDYAYECKTSMGDVEVKDTSRNEKSSKSISGGVASAPYAINADNSMGDIDLEFDAK